MAVRKAEDRKRHQTRMWVHVLSLIPCGALGGMVNGPELSPLEVSRTVSYTPVSISHCPPLEDSGWGWERGTKILRRFWTRTSATGNHPEKVSDASF